MPLLFRPTGLPSSQPIPEARGAKVLWASRRIVQRGLFREVLDVLLKRLKLLLREALTDETLLRGFLSALALGVSSSLGPIFVRPYTTSC